jgi:hypothetical protein
MFVRDVGLLCKNEEHSQRRPLYYGTLILQKIVDTADNTTVFSAMYEFNHNIKVWRYPSKEAFNPQDKFCFTVTVLTLSRDSKHSFVSVQAPGCLEWRFHKEMITPLGYFDSPAFLFEMYRKNPDNAEGAKPKHDINSFSCLSNYRTPSGTVSSSLNSIDIQENTAPAPSIPVREVLSTDLAPSSSLSSEKSQESRHDVLNDTVEPEFFIDPSEIVMVPIEKSPESNNNEENSSNTRLENPKTILHPDDDDDDTLHSIDEPEEPKTRYNTVESVIHFNENSERDGDLSPEYKSIKAFQDTMFSSPSFLSPPVPATSISVIPSSEVFGSISPEMKDTASSKTRKRKRRSPESSRRSSNEHSSTHIASSAPSKNRHSTIFGLPADIFDGINFSLPFLQRDGFNISLLHPDTHVVDGFPKLSVLDSVLVGKVPTLTHSKILFFPSPPKSLSSSSNNSKEASQLERDKIVFHQHQQQISSIPPAQRHHYQQFPLMNMSTSFKRYCSDPVSYSPPVYRLFQPLVYYDYQVPGVKNSFLVFFKKIMNGIDPNVERILLDFWNGHLSFPVAVEPALLFLSNKVEKPHKLLLSSFRLSSIVFGLNPLKDEGEKEVYDSFDENDDYDDEDETEVNTMRKLFKREEKKVSSQLTKEFESILSNDLLDSSVVSSDDSSASNLLYGANLSMDDFKFWLNYSTSKMSDSDSDDKDSVRFEKINSFLSPQFDKCSKALNVLHSIVKSKDTYEFHQKQLFSFRSDATNQSESFREPRKRRGRPPMTQQQPQQQIDENHTRVRQSLSAEALSIALRGKEKKPASSRLSSLSKIGFSHSTDKRKNAAFSSSIDHVLVSSEFRQSLPSSEVHVNKQTIMESEIESSSGASDDDSEREMVAELEENSRIVSSEDF